MNTAIAIALFVMSVRGIEAMGAIMLGIAFFWALGKVLRFK